MVIGLVPDLKTPARHFIAPVAFDPVGYQRLDQGPPFLVGLRRGDIALPPEHRLPAAGQVPGHEAQFHKGTHFHGQQRVIKFVHVVPVIARAAIARLGIHTHLVMQQPVKTDGFEADFRLAKPQLPLPFRAQPFRCPAGTHTFLEDLRMRPLHLLPVGRDVAHRFRRGTVGREQQQDEEYRFGLHGARRRSAPHDRYRFCFSRTTSACNRRASSLRSDDGSLICAKDTCAWMWRLPSRFSRCGTRVMSPQ